jgi:hypothetical protein
VRRRTTPPRRSVDRLAGLDPALDPALVGGGDAGVGLDGEQERDVDVDAVGGRLLDRLEALGGSRGS